MKYENYAESLGFTKTGNVYVMESNGFKVYLKDWQYMVLAIPSFYIPLDREMDKAELKKMEVAAINNVCAAASIGNKADTLIVSLADGKKDSEKTQSTMKDQIERVTKTLKEDGYQPMHICPICQKTAEYSTFGDNFVPVHEECRNSYIEKLKGLAKGETGFRPSYILAIVLAILGAAIGLLPALLLAIFKYNYFAGLLCFVPILLTLGYFLAKAPNKKWLKITIGILNFLIVIGFLCFAVPYMAKGKELTLMEYMFSGKWVGFRKAIFGLLLSFGGFGGMKFLDKFKKDWNKELKKFGE